MSRNRVGLYPGTFDPLTLGHLDIIKRAVKLVDLLVIGVAINADKNPMFNLEERAEMVRHECAAFAGEGKAVIEVRAFSGLLMTYAEEIGANFIIRGLRAVSDFEYEFQMTSMNSKLNSDIETVFLMADAQHQAIASRLVKEIARLGGGITSFVSPYIAGRLSDRLAENSGKSG